MSDETTKAERFYRIRRKSDGAWYAEDCGRVVWVREKLLSDRIHFRPSAEDQLAKLKRLFGADCEIVTYGVTELPAPPAGAAAPGAPADRGAEGADAVARAVAEEREACIRDIEREPELPGEPTREQMLELIKQSQQHGTAGILRAMVRATKNGAIARIRARATPAAPAKGGIAEGMNALRTAGGDAWDKVEDPEAYLREVRGESAESHP